MKKLNKDGKTMVIGCVATAVGAGTAVITNTIIGASQTAAVKAMVIVPWALGVATMFTGMYSFGKGLVGVIDKGTPFEENKAGKDSFILGDAS